MGENYKQYNCIIEGNFMSKINEFADVPCAVGRKLLYPRQLCKLQTSSCADLLPNDLVELFNVVLCTRCSVSIKKET